VFKETKNIRDIYHFPRGMFQTLFRLSAVGAFVATFLIVIGPVA